MGHEMETIKGLIKSSHEILGKIIIPGLIALSSLAAKFSIDHLSGRKLTWTQVISSTILCVFTGVGCGLLWGKAIGPNYANFVIAVTAVIGEKFWLWLFSKWDWISEQLLQTGISLLKIFTRK